MMPTRRAVLVESRKNKIKEFDQLTQLRTKALLRELNIEVLSQKDEVFHYFLFLAIRSKNKFFIFYFYYPSCFRICIKFNEEHKA
jgi:hypothetical protein